MTDRNPFIPAVAIRVPTLNDDFSMDGQIVDDDGVTPTDITGWTFEAQARPHEGATVKVLDLTVAADTTPTDGKFVISVTHEELATAGMTTGDYWWDLLVTDAADVQRTWAGGPFSIGPRYTVPEVTP